MGVAPNARTFASLISACERGGQGQQALEVFEEMRRMHVVPDAPAYNALINACSKSGLRLEAARAFREMQDRRVGTKPCCVLFVLKYIG